MNNENEKTLSQSDFAFVLGISQTSISNLIAADSGPPFERGARKSVIYKIEDVEQWIDDEEKTKIAEVKLEAAERRDRLATFKKDKKGS